MIVATNVLALALLAALNPLVARAPQQRGNTPADCVVSDAAPMTRITAPLTQPPLAEDTGAVQAVRPASRPASSTNPTADIAELKRALAANDRPSFDAALARARAAGVATRVYDDIARIWDAQFESPFFAEDSNAYRVASSYPGYAEAVRRQIFTDAAGRKFYPAAESRAFVATHAGVSMPATRTVSRSTRSTSTSSSAPSRKAPASSTTRSTSKPASRKPAASRTKASPSSPDPSAAPKIAAREPAPVVPSAVVTSSAQAPPAAGSLDTVVTETPVVSTATVPVDTAEATEKTASALPDTTATASETAAAPVSTPAVPQAKGRPIIIPAILILIGLGVLVLLFRTKA